MMPRRVFACALLLTCGISCDERPRPAGRLTVASQELELGTIWEDHDFARKVKITSTYDETVKVKLSKSCDCTSIEPETLEIGPGGEAEVVLRFDLTKDQGEPQSASRRFSPKFAATVGGDEKEQYEWQIGADVRKMFSLSNKVVTVDPSGAAAGEDQGLMVGLLTPVSPIRKIEARCDPGIGDVSVEQVPGSKDGDYLLSLHLSENPAGDSLDSWIEIAGFAEDGGRSRDRIRVEGTKRVGVWISPREILAGSSPVGSVREEEVEIGSPGQGVVVDHIDRSADTIEVNKMATNDSKACRYRVKLSVGRKGRIDESVKFHVIGTDGIQRVLILPVTALGTDRPGSHPRPEG